MANEHRLQLKVTSCARHSEARHGLLSGYECPRWHLPAQGCVVRIGNLSFGGAAFIHGLSQTFWKTCCSPGLPLRSRLLSNSAPVTQPLPASDSSVASSASASLELKRAGASLWTRRWPTGPLWLVLSSVRATGPFSASAVGRPASSSVVRSPRSALNFLRELLCVRRVAAGARGPAAGLSRLPAAALSVATLAFESR